MQSKINLIPLYNIKTLFHRANRNEEAVEIDYMCALSLICSRRYFQACEALMKVQTKLLYRISCLINDEVKGNSNQMNIMAKQGNVDPKDSKYYPDMMKAAEIEILIAE